MPDHPIEATPVPRALRPVRRPRGRDGTMWAAGAVRCARGPLPRCAGMQFDADLVGRVTEVLQGASG